MPDTTGFRPRRGTWTAATATVAATALFFLLFARQAWPEAAQLLFEGRGRPERLTAVLLGLGGMAGGALAGLRFGLVLHPRSLGIACRLAGAVAVVALLASGPRSALAVSLAGGFSVGWLAVTLVSGLRASVGLGGLGTALGLGIGLAGAFSSLPMLADAGARAQTIVAALVILTVSVLTPFLTPQDPSVSSWPVYSVRGLSRWLAALFGSALFAAVLVTEARISGAAGGSGSGAADWLPAAAAALGGAAAGWWLDRGLGGGVAMLVAAAAGALLVSALVGFAVSAPAIASSSRAAGAAALAVGFAYYAARSGRARDAAAVVAIAWLGWTIGVLWAANRFDG